MLQEPLMPTPINGLRNVMKMITSQPNLDVDLFHHVIGFFDFEKMYYDLGSTFFDMMQYLAEQQSITLLDQYVTLIEPLLNTGDDEDYNIDDFYDFLFMFCCRGQSLQLAQHVYNKYKPVTNVRGIDLFFIHVDSYTHYMNVDIFKWLLTLPGAKSNLNSLMVDAVASGCRNIVDALIEVNAKVDIVDKNPSRSHLLFTALQQDNRGIIDLIYNATTETFNLNQRNVDGAVRALRSPTVTGLEWLLDQHNNGNHIDFDCVDDQGNTFLHDFIQQN